MNFAWDLGRYVVAAGGLFLVVWVIGRERWAPRLIAEALGVARRTCAARSPTRCRRRSSSRSSARSFISARARACFRLDDGHRGARLGLWWRSRSSRSSSSTTRTSTGRTARSITRWLFKHVHRAHHLSSNPSPWAAYAFSPGEALVQAAYVPLVMLVLPVQELALFAFLTYMIVRNVIGHAGVELFPRGFVHGPFHALSTTTTHHALHHRRSDVNFGLYFPWWDWVMKTTHPHYEAEIRRGHGLPKGTRSERSLTAMATAAAAAQHDHRFFASPPCGGPPSSRSVARSTASRSSSATTKGSVLPIPDGLDMSATPVRAAQGAWEIDARGAVAGVLKLRGRDEDVASFARSGASFPIVPGDYGLLQYGQFGIFFQYSTAATPIGDVLGARAPRRARALLERRACTSASSGSCARS